MTRRLRRAGAFDLLLGRRGRRPLDPDLSAFADYIDVPYGDDNWPFTGDPLLFRDHLSVEVAHGHGRSPRSNGVRQSAAPVSSRASSSRQASGRESWPRRRGSICPSSPSAGSCTWREGAAVSGAAAAHDRLQHLLLLPSRRRVDPLRRARAIARRPRTARDETAACARRARVRHTISGFPEMSPDHNAVIRAAA